MPVLFIEAPPGIRPGARKKMVQKRMEAIDEAYHIGDTLIFLGRIPPKTWHWTESSSRRIPKSLKRSGESSQGHSANS